MCQPPEEHGHRDNPLHFDRRGQVPTFPESFVSPRRPIGVSGPCGTLPKNPNPDSRPPPYNPNPMSVGAWGRSPAKPPYGDLRQGNFNPDQAFAKGTYINSTPDQRLTEAGTWGGSPRNTLKPTQSIGNANQAFGHHTYTNSNPDSVDGNGNSSRTNSIGNYVAYNLVCGHWTVCS